MPDVILETNPVALCQCQPPCLLPFRGPEGKWSTYGCMGVKDHDPPCGPEGAGDWTYRDPPERIGLRIVLRQVEPGGLYRGTCPRCARVYAFGAATLGAHAVEFALGGTDGNGLLEAGDRLCSTGERARNTAALPWLVRWIRGAEWRLHLRPIPRLEPLP